MIDVERCGKRYGRKRRRTCRRFAQHRGQHAIRLSTWELGRLAALRRAERRRAAA